MRHEFIFVQFDPCLAVSILFICSLFNEAFSVTQVI
jgi:hypothetical protein